MDCRSHGCSNMASIETELITNMWFLPNLYCFIKVIPLLYIEFRAEWRLFDWKQLDRTRFIQRLKYNSRGNFFATFAYEIWSALWVVDDHYLASSQHPVLSVQYHFNDRARIARADRVISVWKTIVSGISTRRIWISTFPRLKMSRYLRLEQKISFI